ncbi:MAG: glycosyltransferase family 2 protein [Thermoleophilia bacterium]|nr:glycosyltransferase family 2 protein [Thermoleophilia bacterium]
MTQAFSTDMSDEGTAVGDQALCAASDSETKPCVAAVVVLYHPPEDILANIDSYRDQVALVIAIDNSEAPDRHLVACLQSGGVDYSSLDGNRGLAAALNEGCRRARALGFEWALTFDQDSTATPDMVARLFSPLRPDSTSSRPCETRGCSSDSLRPTTGRIAIVAPVWQQVGGVPVPTTGEHAEIDTALTSGSLTRLSAFEELGGFREDLFIDCVDHEFCLRARRHGWSIVQRRDAVLLHRMGHIRRIDFPVRFWVTDHAPLRRYYMARNLREVKRQYGREFPAWLARERRYRRKDLVKLLLAEPHRLQKAGMMIQGWTDYRRGRFGRYEDLHPGGPGHSETGPGATP